MSDGRANSDDDAPASSQEKEKAKQDGSALNGSSSNHTNGSSNGTGDGSPLTRLARSMPAVASSQDSVPDDDPEPIIYHATTSPSHATGTPSPSHPHRKFSLHEGNSPLFSDPRVIMRMERRLSSSNMLRIETQNLPPLSPDASVTPHIMHRTLSSSGGVRPSTPDVFSSPRQSPRAGTAPDSPGALPRSPSSDPRKKTIDDFHIGKVLGEGSYGAVVLGTDKETGAQYAIKILEKKHILKENKVKYVNTERDILGHCSHPGIVKLYYTFRSETSLYYVLEICPNGELLSPIKQNGGLDEESIQYYIAEIIEVLEYLHSKGVVHRDLKPENILLSSDWHVKLTDFGTAKVLGTEKNARSGSFVGTPEYMSPELISSKETCCASDLWALGSIVYQMYANRLPFRAKTEFLTFQKVSNREISFPPNFPPVAKDLIENLLTLKPEERLGARQGGFEELKKHAFFNGVPWGQLRDRKPPPFKKPSIVMQFEELSPPPSPGDASSRSNLLRTSSGSSLSTSTPGSPREREKWARFLMQDENVTYVGLVWKRKGLSIKKRYLLLTDTPRLVYIDPKKMLQKGEIPWSDQLRPELKSSANFFVHTPKRKYVLEDTTNNAQKWVDELQAAMTAFGNQKL